MTPAPISTKNMPLPRRTSSESSHLSSGMSSPTSPMSSSTLAAATEQTGFLARMRARSPTRRHTLASPTSAMPSPALSQMQSPATAKRPSVEHPRASSVASPAMSPRQRPAKRHSGTTMQCGRHSNDWLFGGFSITDTVRDLLKDGGK